MTTQNPTIANFVSKYMEPATAVAASNNIPVSFVLGQWGEETGWGQNMAGTNNLGNVSPGGSVANYTTLSDGVAAYSQVLQKDNVQGIHDPTQFGNALASAGYASDPNYATSIASAINTVSPYVDAAGSSGSAASPSFASQIKPINSYVDPNSGLLTNVGKTVAGVAGDAGSTIESFITAKAGNYGLVIFGGLLALGALLISQKKNIVQVAGTAAKVAAIAA